MWRSGGVASPFFTSALDGSKQSASFPGRFTPEEIVPVTQWIGRWVSPRADLDHAGKRTRTVQPIVHHYTDWAIRTSSDNAMKLIAKDCVQDTSQSTGNGTVRDICVCHRWPLFVSVSGWQQQVTVTSHGYANTLNEFLSPQWGLGSTGIDTVSFQEHGVTVTQFSVNGGHFRNGIWKRNSFPFSVLLSGQSGSSDPPTSDYFYWATGRAKYSYHKRQT
jgi:hypothetical protein